MPYLKSLLVVSLVLSASTFAADVKRINKNNVQSTSIKKLVPTVAALHKLAAKDNLYERELTVWSVSPAEGEREMAAITQLVDEANSFASAEEGEESVEARKRPSVGTAAVGRAVVSPNYDNEDAEGLDSDLLDGIQKLKARLNALAKVEHLSLYEISSSNESQGHVGLVLYNQDTEEALYFSTISDH